MTLVIEDGSSPDGANSYVTLVEARTFALLRGVTLSATDSVVEILAIKAMDFLESLESKYKGTRVSDDQPLAWPRDDVYLFDAETLFANDDIPVQLKNAQCQLIIDAVSVDLMPRGTGREIVRQKVDVIETEYAKTGSGTVMPQLNKAMAFLAQCLNGGGLSVRTVRV